MRAPVVSLARRIGWFSVLVGLGWSAPAGAVPIFARKYETSCQTCHTAFPKLNPFGEAFRRNGHRFPGDEDEDAVKQQPIAMGQEAHKRVFPEAVWPSSLPSTAPLSAQVGSSFAYDPKSAEKLSLAGLGANLGINLAASLGDVVSVWAAGFFRAMPAATGGETIVPSLERVFVSIKPFDQPWAMLRVGRIEPEVATFTSHRTLGLPSWMFSRPVGDDPFILEPAQLGLEVTGVVLSGRLAYSAGLVEGSGGLPNQSKNGYGRVAYKLGGMRLDGVGGATQTEPWREKSATVGLFGYAGQARIGAAGVAEQEDRYWVAGAEANLLFRDANLIVGYSMGKNRRPMLAMPNEPRAGSNLFTQLDYVVFPWLIPTLRYEHRRDALISEQRISGGVYFLILAQVRAQVLASASDSKGAMGLDQLQAGLNLAF